MFNVSQLLEIMNATIRVANPMDATALSIALKVSNPKYVIELARCISLVDCQAFDGALRGSVIYDFGNNNSLLFIIDGLGPPCDSWPEIEGAKPVITVSPHSSIGRNVTYSCGDWRFGAAFDSDTKAVCLLFSESDLK